MFGGVIEPLFFFSSIFYKTMARAYFDRLYFFVDLCVAVDFRLVLCSWHDTIEHFSKRKVLFTKSPQEHLQIHLISINIVVSV